MTAPIDKVAGLFNINSDDLAVAEYGEWRDFDVKLTQEAYETLIELFHEKETLDNMRKNRNLEDNEISALRQAVDFLAERVRYSNSKPIDPNRKTVLLSGDYNQAKITFASLGVPLGKRIYVYRPIEQLAALDGNRHQIKFVGTWSTAYNPVILWRILQKAGNSIY